MTPGYLRSTSRLCVCNCASILSDPIQHLMRLLLVYRAICTQSVPGNKFGTPYTTYLVRGRRWPKTVKPLTTSHILLPPVLSSPSIWSVIPNQMQNCSSTSSFAMRIDDSWFRFSFLFMQRNFLFHRHIFVIAFIYFFLFTNLLITEFPSENIVDFILFHFTFAIWCAVGYTYVKRAV